MTNKSNIILVDDNEFFRQSLKLFIDLEGIGEVVAEANNGQMFLDLLETFNPDLVILDLEMPVMNGFEASKKANEIKPGLKILILAMTFAKYNYTSLIENGIKGFVLKSSGKQDLEKAIHSVLAGESYFSSNRFEEYN